MLLVRQKVGPPLPKESLKGLKGLKGSFIVV